MVEKKELRKKAKEIRMSLDMKKLSEKIIENILQQEVYIKANNVMIFFPLKHEVNLLGLLESKKSFYLPKVQAKNLLVCPYKKGDLLIESAFQTKEPTTDPVSPEILDIIFVPALMADNNFNRLGYGGGFYDRFLSDKSIKAVKIIAIPCQLITDNLPNEDFDIKMDMIVCEELLSTLKSDN